jgi:hypothetical protein
MLNSITGVLASGMKGSYASVVLADNPVGFWLLNETSGTTASDLTANGNNLTYTASPTLNVSTGLSGVTTGVTYNGTTQYAASSEVATFNMPSSASWSIEGWFRTTSTSSGSVFMFRDDSAVNAGVGGGLFVNLTANKATAFTPDSAFNSLTIVSSTTVNTGAWFHGCITAASGGAMTLYINGASEASTSTTRGLTVGSKIVSTAAQPQTPPTFVSFFNGSSAAIAIYSTTLSAAQVLAHYNAGI